jgi:hypothetical protein
MCSPEQDPETLVMRPGLPCPHGNRRIETYSGASSMPLLRKETIASASSKTVTHAIARAYSERCVRLWDDRCGGYVRCLGPPTIAVLLKPDDADERLAVGENLRRGGRHARCSAKVVKRRTRRTPLSSRREGAD